MKIYTPVTTAALRNVDANFGFSVRFVFELGDCAGVWDEQTDGRKDGQDTYVMCPNEKGGVSKAKDKVMCWVSRHHQHRLLKNYELIKVMNRVHD